MGMVVRTNTMAMNANRQLGVNNSTLAKSLEKLSSGYRINRAGDDASGLAISEKMKAQIKGLEQASANSQDGISLVQTAEGATTEIHNMLNRMVELATKSANGTIQDNVDREAIQAEVDALNGEITRIAQSTNFNGINLLDGSLGVASSVGAKYGTTNLTFTTNSKIDSDALGATHTIGITTSAAAASATISNAGVVTINLKAGESYSASEITQLVRDQALANANDSGVATTPALKAMYEAWTSFTAKSDGMINAVGTTASDPAAAAIANTSAKGGLTLQVGDTADAFNKVTVSVDNLSAAGLGINGLKVNTEANSASSIKTIKDAINKVSTNRANLGALQNRLEYTINNLDTTTENMSAANSRIRDTDMAKEMTNYTKMNILTQAAQAMLAQANQQPQQILQLLQ